MSEYSLQDPNQGIFGSKQDAKQQNKFLREATREQLVSLVSSLESIMELSFTMSYKDMEKGYNLVIDALKTCDLPYTAELLREHRYLAKQAAKVSEKDIENYFLTNFTLLSEGIEKLEGARVVRMDTMPGHIPDGFIELKDKKTIPVEVKKVFAASDLKQIYRYMRNYKSDIGIVVATEFNCVIPKDLMQFTIKGTIK